MRRPREIGMYMTFYFSKKHSVHNKTWKWFHDLLSSESWKSCPNLKCASDSGFRHYFRHVFGHWNLWFVCEGLDKEYALDRLLHGHIFATETRKLGSWKRSVLSCVENGACVHVCLSFAVSWIWSPFCSVVCRSSNQSNDKSALTKAAPPAVPPDCVSYNTKGACCPSLVAWWKRDLVAWSCLCLKGVSMSPERDLTDLEKKRGHTNLISLQSQKGCNKFQLQDSPMWLRLVTRIFRWASKSLHLGGRFSKLMLWRQTLRYTETCYIEFSQ